MYKSKLLFISLLLTVLGCSDKNPETSESTVNIPILVYDSELLETLTLDKKNIKIDPPKEFFYWTQHFQNPKNNIGNIFTSATFSNKEKINSGKNGPLNIIQPIFFQNNICNISNDGFLECYDTTSDKLNFKTDIKPKGINNYQIARGGIAYFDSRLVSVDAYGQIFLINASNGNKIWEINIGFPILSPPLIYRDYVYFISSDNRVFCLSLEDGSVEWSFQTTSETRKNLFTASPVANENLIIVPFSNGDLISFIYDSGRPVWSESLSKITMISNFDIKDIVASPVIIQNNIYALSSNGKLISVSLINGKRNWSTELSGYRTPVISGNQIYVINSDGKLICIDINSGEIYWIRDLEKYKKGKKKVENLNLWLGPYLINDLLYTLSYFGELKVISPFTGEILDVQNTGISKILTPPVIVKEAIYVSDENANIFRFK